MGVTGANGYGTKAMINQVDDYDRGNGDPTIEARFDALERTEAMNKEELEIIEELRRHPRLLNLCIQFGSDGTARVSGFSSPEESGNFCHAANYYDKQPLHTALVEFRAYLPAHLALRDAEPKVCAYCGHSLDVPPPGMTAQEENPTNDDGVDLPPNPPYAEGGAAVFGGRL